MKEEEKQNLQITRRTSTSSKIEASDEVGLVTKGISRDKEGRSQESRRRQMNFCFGIIGLVTRIVNRALERDALIVLGDIKHLRKRKQNKLHTNLTEGWVSVLQTDPLSTKQRGDFSLGAFHVTMLSERYKERSIMFCCNRCCDENADRDAAFNIAYRTLEHISKVGVSVNPGRYYWW